MKEITVWDLQTRIFHWSLVVCTLCAFVTADILIFFGIDLVNRDTWLHFHIGAGVAMGILLFFRILWGLQGPHHSRFSSLRLSPKELVVYFDTVRKNIKTSHTGHNPAASWSFLCIIVLGLSALISGVVVYGLDEGRGLLRPLYLGFHSLAEEFKLLHLGLAYAILAVILGHVSGVMLETVRHKTGIITAMFTGRKLSDEAEAPVTMSTPLTVISFGLVLSPLMVILYFANPTETRPQLSAGSPPLYKKECGTCHMAFSPNMLPEKSWIQMMATLQDHFGEDATIDDASKKEIEAFLVTNAAEKSHEEASIKFIRAIGANTPPLRITDITYWKKKHQQIPPEVYARGTINSKINCVACHKWAEYGSFEDGDIRIPRN